MKKEIVEVNLEGLVKALMAIKGATPATFVARTNVKMNKRNNPYYGEIDKIQKSNVFINFNYTNSVNKQRVKEGKEPDFVAKERKWGVKVPGTPLILHKNSYYLEARFLNNEPDVEYIYENSEIDKNEFSMFLPNRSRPTNQNTEKEIIIRDFKVENIQKITFGGKTYIRTDV